MSILHFTYEMQIEYSYVVNRCNFTIKCFPKDNARQRVENQVIKLFPATHFCEGVDGLGNKQIYGVNEEPHTIFNFFTEGDVVTGCAEWEEDEDENISMVFNHPYGLNRAGTSICALYEKIKPGDAKDNYDAAIKLMNGLHDNFKYEPGATNINTTAEEAFSKGKGVCQDYAHIFIALLHLYGIPARYVTGLTKGEGQSHAWVEILCERKWYGLDPTNNIKVFDKHIKIGVGRDAKDCAINRGIMHGGGCQAQIIKAKVIERE